MNSKLNAPTALTRTKVRVRGPAGGPPEDDLVADEIPVALVYNGISHAVMMVTPTDLEDFAVGFSLTEAILQNPDELYDIEADFTSNGATLEMRIAAERLIALKSLRRSMAGRTGCGLCGIESLAMAVRPTAAVKPHPMITDAAIQRAVAELQAYQPLQADTGATHGAAWCDLEGRILDVREDVGRHNALDKLVGCRMRGGGDLARGFALISSRASFELVQKSAAVGIDTLVAVSAPTAMAIRKAREAGMTLVGFARPGRHVIYN